MPAVRPACPSTPVTLLLVARPAAVSPLRPAAVPCTVTDAAASAACACRLGWALLSSLSERTRDSKGCQPPVARTANRMQRMKGHLQQATCETCKEEGQKAL